MTLTKGWTKGFNLEFGIYDCLSKIVLLAFIVDRSKSKNQICGCYCNNME